MQIGCCTGQRGHNCSFVLKAEFVTEGSPLFGHVVYSVPIDVGAKGPFAKVFAKNSQQEEASVEPLEKPSGDLTVALPNVSNPSYEGAEEMIALLKKLTLQVNISFFLTIVEIHTPIYRTRS